MRHGEYKYDDRAIVQQLADGETLEDIAARIGARSTNPIRYFLDRVRREHGLRTREQMVAHYVRNEWVD